MPYIYQNELLNSVFYKNNELSKKVYNWKNVKKSNLYTNINNRKIMFIKKMIKQLMLIFH